MTGVKWWSNTIFMIIKNEKYKGDIILQKYYTPDHLKKQHIINNGAVDRYYIEDNHPQIVSREVWDNVQSEIKRRGISKRPKEHPLFITKSISRFARNTLDCLNYVRILKELHIAVIFEKENINTLDSKGEVLLTILSSLAQDESRSISENTTWGIRREFEDEGVQIWNGKSKWYDTTIGSILSNEKYKGDAILQKSYSVDFLTKKRVKNKGEVQQYYVEDSHPAIIDKEMWETVQLEMERRRTFVEKYRLKRLDYGVKNNPFAGRVICGHCGSSFGRKIWNSNDERLRRVVWRCNRKYAVKGKKSCDNKHIDDSVLYKAFINAFNAMIENRDYFMEKWKEEVQSENALVRYKAKQFIKIIENA